MMHIWNSFLYQPVFNALIWIYNNWTDHNFGWAVVYLTLLLRICLLPFTLVSEHAEQLNDDISKDVARIDKEYHNDHILKKQEIRRLLKKRRVSPWSKAIVLGMQGIVLILLYQVFLRGITGEKVLQILYPSIDFPGSINTIFYGFDLGMKHDSLWAGIVMVWLMAEIYMGLRRSKGSVSTSDLAYFVLFPLFIFFALWLLPMVKSLFVLTSIIFSVVVHQFSKLFFKPKKSKI